MPSRRERRSRTENERRFQRRRNAGETPEQIAHSENYSVSYVKQLTTAPSPEPPDEAPSEQCLADVEAALRSSSDADSSPVEGREELLALCERLGISVSADDIAALWELTEEHIVAPEGSSSDPEFMVIDLAQCVGIALDNLEGFTQSPYMPLSGDPASVPRHGEVVALAHTNAQIPRTALEALSNVGENAPIDDDVRSHFQRLTNWYRNVRPLFEHGLTHFGVWTQTHDEHGNPIPLEDQVTEMSANLVLDEPSIARRLARTQDQKATFNMGTFEETPIGGKDRMPWDGDGTDDYLRVIATTLPDVLRSAYDLDDD